MKFKVSMKCPDALYESVQEAAAADVAKLTGIDADERDELIESRAEKVRELCCKKWF